MSPAPPRAPLEFLESACRAGVFPGCALAWGCPGQENPGLPQERAVSRGELNRPGTVNGSGPAGADWGAVEFAAAGRRGLSRNLEPADINLVYDLASVTKIMSTTILVMITIDAGKICLDSGLTEITRLCPPALRNLRVRDLLTHQSGLPAWRPYYLNPALSDPGRLAAAIASEPRSGAPGDLTVYSDLNFILLGLILERIWGKSLKDLFSELIAAPLGLRLTGYRPDPLTSGVAPTEDGFRLGGPLDFPGVPVLGPVPLGRVHDDNAAALGGVAGQAGLFGAAPELWLIIRDLSRSLRGDKGLLVKKNTLNAFLQARPPRVGGPVRAAGFDIGQGALAEARGHLGYTGGSVWWDCQGDRAYILLCNRVQPTARRSKMEAFRRELESILWEV